MPDNVNALFQVRAQRHEMDDKEIAPDEAMRQLARWLSKPETHLSLADLSDLIDVGAVLFRWSQLRKQEDSVHSKLSES